MSEKNNNHDDDSKDSKSATTFEEKLAECKKEFYKNQRVVLLNLPRGTTSDNIKKFANSDSIEHIHINRKRHKAILSLSDGNLAEKMAEELNNKEMNGHKINSCVSQPDNTLCISGLPLDFTNEQLRKHLKHYGRLEKCFILPDKDFSSKGIALVQFGLNLDKSSAVKTLINSKCYGKQRVMCDFLPYEVSKFDNLDPSIIVLKNLPREYKNRKDFKEKMCSIGVKPIFCSLALNEGKSLEFGVVEYPDSKDAITAWHTFHNTYLLGEKSRITVHLAIPGKSALSVFDSQIRVELTRINDSLLPEPRPSERDLDLKRTSSPDGLGVRGLKIINRDSLLVQDRDDWPINRRYSDDSIDFDNRRSLAIKRSFDADDDEIFQQRKSLRSLTKKDDLQNWTDSPSIQTQIVKPLMDFSQIRRPGPNEETPSAVSENRESFLRQALLLDRLEDERSLKYQSNNLSESERNLLRIAKSAIGDDLDGDSFITDRNRSELVMAERLADRERNWKQERYPSQVSKSDDYVADVRKNSYAESKSKGYLYDTPIIDDSGNLLKEEERRELERLKWEERNKHFVESWNKGGSQPSYKESSSLGLISKQSEKRDDDIDALLGNLKDALSQGDKTAKLKNFLKSLSSDSNDQQQQQQNTNDMKSSYHDDRDHMKSSSFSESFYSPPSNIETQKTAIKRTSDGQFVHGYRPSASTIQQFIPRQEPPSETGYIGQHAQGIGGHYEDSYKRRRL